MEEYKGIIDALKRQKTAEPVCDMTERIMAKISQEGGMSSGGDWHYRFRRLFANGKQEANRITTYSQCAVLLFVVGVFYFVAGLTALLRLHDAMGSGYLTFWLQVQPFIPAVSGLLILAAAFLLVVQPYLAMVIEYFLLFHVLFLFVNTAILENVLSFPWPFIYVIILTMLPVTLGILLIGALRSAHKMHGEDDAKTI